jgi:hypothetical protein
MCPLYVSGLIGPGDRKNVQPMAPRPAPGDYDQLHVLKSGGRAGPSQDMPRNSCGSPMPSVTPTPHRENYDGCIKLGVNTVDRSIRAIAPFGKMHSSPANRDSVCHE